MKILCYRSLPDFHFESIISCLSNIKNTKFQIGYISGEINLKSISDFSPDVIIHNIKEADKFPIKENVISININETDGKNSFSFKKEGPNFLKPFVTLKKVEVDEVDLDKFSSDVVYIGSPTIFKDLLSFLINEKNKIRFKFFTHVSHNINGYCGMCDSTDYLKFYNNAKASLVKDDDVQRIMDIVISDGNPILFNGSNYDECISLIKESLSRDVKYSIHGYKKEDIIKNDTSFDRAYQIFRTVGLNKLAEEISKVKNLHWNKK